MTERHSPLTTPHPRDAPLLTALLLRVSATWRETSGSGRATAYDTGLTTPFKTFFTRTLNNPRRECVHYHRTTGSQSNTGIPDTGPKKEMEDQNMKRTVAITCTGIVALGLLAPQPVKAGDSEWATAGKILTGLVAAHVLTGGLRCAPSPQRTHVVERRVIHQPTVIVEERVVREPTVIIQERVIREPVVVVEERIVRQSYPSTHIEIVSYGSSGCYTNSRTSYSSWYSGSRGHDRHGYQHGRPSQRSSGYLSTRNPRFSSRANDISGKIAGHTVRRVR